MYIFVNTMLIAGQVELIDNYKFVQVALNKSSKIFTFYIAALETLKLVEMRFIFFGLIKL